MRVSAVRVVFQKKLTDGAYGNEMAEVELTAELGDEDSVGEASAWAQTLLAESRHQVLERLKGSVSEAVREGACTREENEARWEQERERRPRAPSRREAAEP